MSHKKVRENKDFCGIAILSEKDKVLKFNHFTKSDEMAYISYAETWSLNVQIDGCANDWEKSCSIKLVNHIPCGYSMSTIWAFDHIENKHTFYRGENFTKKTCSSLREHATNILNFEKKKKLRSIKEESARWKITPRCNKLLHLWKWNVKNMC